MTPDETIAELGRIIIGLQYEVLRRIAEEFKSERDAAKRDAMRAFDERNIALAECERLRALVRARSSNAAAAHDTAEVRNNPDGSLDEVVGTGRFHLEQMDTGHWWLGIGDGPMLHVNLHSRNKITANVWDERPASSRAPAVEPSIRCGDGWHRLTTAESLGTHCPQCGIGADLSEPADRAAHQELGDAT